MATSNSNPDSKAHLPRINSDNPSDSSDWIWKHFLSPLVNLCVFRSLFSTPYDEEMKEHTYIY